MGVALLAAHAALLECDDKRAAVVAIYNAAFGHE